MPLRRDKSAKDDGHWRVCLECGNRFQTRRASSTTKWCSTRCQTESYRAGRNQVLESLSIGSRWWLG